MKKLIGIVLFGVCCGHAQAVYDVLLKGGHVIDAKSNIDGPRDIAIKAGKIAEVSAFIDPSNAKKTIDVNGLYVTPGLVDIHEHLFAGDPERPLGVYPDSHTLRSGVTTAVDAGTSGWRDVERFKRTIADHSVTRVLAFLNIVGTGMTTSKAQQNTADMDAQKTGETAKAMRDFVVGIKTAHYQGPEWIPVERAVEAARIAGIPVMVDFGRFRPERPFQELVLQKLRPGDIYTHLYLNSVPMLDDQGKLLPYLLEARKRGVIFDVGHGQGSFLWRQAVPAIRQGFVPDSISTDLHTGSMNSGMKDMLEVMSKFLVIGMTLQDVVLRSTWNPAKEIHREELGNLSVGAPADIAVLRVEKGRFGFVDVYKTRMDGDRRLVCEMTLKGGRVVYELNGITRERWDKLGKYGPQGDLSWDGTGEDARPASRH